MKKDILSKKLLGLIFDEDLDIDLDELAERIGNEAIHTSGVLGVALVVASADNSAMAVLNKSKLMKTNELIKRLENHVARFKEENSEDFGNDDDENNTSDDENLDPKTKLLIAMVAKDGIDKDGVPSGELMAKTFVEMKKLKDKDVPTSIAVVKALNKALGSPLSKKEEEELSEWSKKNNDED